jgi:hypothetical protein
MTKSKKHSNEDYKKQIKKSKNLLYIYLGVVILSLIISLFTLSTLGFITFFTFLIMCLFLFVEICANTILLNFSEGMEEIKDMIKILEEGDNYDK